MLNRSLLAAGCAAALLWSSPAAAGHWDFSYTGFLHEESGEFRPDIKLSGSFDGNDSDGNGKIERWELTKFYLDGTQYVGCGAPPLDFYQCNISAFSFTPGGTLSFGLQYTYSDYAFMDIRQTTISGDRQITRRDYVVPVPSYVYTLVWTDATTLAISPVPEPLPAAMLIAGLAVLAGAHRSRDAYLLKRRTRPAARAGR